MRRTLCLIVLIFAAACTAKPVIVPVRVLESWQPQEDTLTQQDASRAWRFSGQRGDAVVLRLDSKAGGQVTLALQAPDGQTLAQGDALRLTLPDSGIYTALVRLDGGGSTAYSLTLSYADRAVPTATPTPTITPTPSNTATPTFTPSSTPTATYTPTPSDTPTMTYTPTQIYAPLGTLSGRLEMGATVTGSFLSEFERHIYLFSGAAGQLVTLSMVGTSGSVDPVLTLYDPNGQPMATDDNSGGGSAALLRDIHLPTDGDYIVQALGGGSGNYQITLEAGAPTPVPPTLTPTALLGTTTPVAADAEELSDHVPMMGVIDKPDAFNRYFIDAQAGDVLTVGVRPADGSPLRPRVEVYTPSGELMLSAGLGSDGQALIPAIGVPDSGKYAVFVSDDARTGGAYTIAYGRGSTHTDDLRGGLPPNTPAASSGLSAVRDAWTLPLTAGDDIDVEARGAALQVVAPSGADIAGAQDVVQFNAPLSGDYRVLAVGSPFSLSWRYVVAAPTPPAPLLILSADDPLPAQTYLYYPFQGEAGRHVHVRVRALSAGLDPVAALLDASGATVATGDDSPGSLDPDFEALLPADGTYNLRVNGYGETGGSVRVTVEMLS